LAILALIISALLFYSCAKIILRGIAKVTFGLLLYCHTVQASTLKYVKYAPDEKMKSTYTWGIKALIPGVMTHANYHVGD
jgi:threonine/homoserine efflux transporter RhtA